jgi:hypothetical protein
LAGTSIQDERQQHEVVADVVEDPLVDQLP